MNKRRLPDFVAKTNELWLGIYAGLWIAIFLHLVETKITQAIHMDLGLVWRYENIFT